METVLRVSAIYVAVLIGLRILGKREFGQLSPLELVTLMLIPEIVSQSMIREDFSLTNGLVGVYTLFSLVFLTSLLMQKSKAAEKLIADEPAVLVRFGNIDEEALARERVTTEEIFAAMHVSGLDSLDQVRWAILESDGRVSIVPEPPAPASGPQQSPETTG